ncbi:UNVERIFIED_CONTAM: stage III sporulation protein AH [Brevibacillus sp. OAP136]
MMLRKQTVWLLTMLAVMVVLSGYYLVKGPNEQLPALGNEQKTTSPDAMLGVDVNTQTADPQTTPAQLPTTIDASGAGAAVLPTPNATAPDTTATQNGNTAPNAQVTPDATQPDSSSAPTAAQQQGVTTSDFFQGYKMQRDAMLAKQKDEQFSIMSSDKSSPQAYADAKKKHEELSTMESNTAALEELLKGSGYKDAVVLPQNDKVQVIVQADKLTNKEVVDIIATVKQQMNVSGNNVIVQSKP